MDPLQLPARATPFLLPLLTLLLLLPSPFRCDPDPLQDLCVGVVQPSDEVPLNGFPCKAASAVVDDDFFFSGLAKEGNTSNPFGSVVTPANVLAFPGLNTLGLSMNRVDIAPGGVNPPHLHPRATELVLVVEGKLLVGFVTTGNVFFSKIVTSGEMFVVPRGLVHFQYNVGDGKAVVFAAFNSQLPGAVVVAPALFGSKPSIPSEVLAKAFQVDELMINGIKGKFGS